MDNEILFEQIDEEEVQKEFEKALLEAIAIYEITKDTNYPQLEIFIDDKVWKALEKYTRMDNTTKEKFFDSLLHKVPVNEYSKEIEKLWGDIDHSYMDRTIKELEKMVIQRDFKDYEMYTKKKITKRSIKLQNFWEEYKLYKKKMYELHPGRDFTTIERRYINRHIKLYKNFLKSVEKSDDIERTLTGFMKRYDQLNSTVPYFSHKTGKIIRYVDVGTYNSMLYNVNLTRSAWNRVFYDSLLLGEHLFYLEPHTYSCPGCAYYHGYVYADRGATPEELIEMKPHAHPYITYIDQVLEDYGNQGTTIGHPNCSHVWQPYISDKQISKDKYNSPEWEEKYKTKQKIQSLDLKKSRLLADRRIYNNLGQQDLVDKTTSKIKRIREQKKELEKSL